MESFIKIVKKRNRKAGGEDQPAQKTENHPSLDYNSSFRDEEELVDYEPESPPRMSAGEDELYSDYDQIPAHWVTIGKLSSIVDHAVMQWRDVCHVVPFHPMPCWTMPSCSGVMFVMLSHSIPCHTGPCHHAVV